MQRYICGRLRKEEFSKQQQKPALCMQSPQPHLKNYKLSIISSFYSCFYYQLIPSFNMISPKFSLTHYAHSAKAIIAAKNPAVPHIVNLYLDYNCPFSAKLYLKLKSSVIPQLQEKHPNSFQFVFVNVVQPWHPNSVLLNEYSLVFAKLLREGKVENSNELFWDASAAIFDNKELFYDSSNINLTRNEIYKQINDLVFEKVPSIPFSKDSVLDELVIKESKEPSNGGNGATVDLKYFTRYLRNVGVHVTPTVSVDGIVNDAISSGTEPEKLIEIFEAALWLGRRVSVL